MSTATEYDVIIVGGGMVGATLACALAQGGMSIAVIESHEPPAFDPEADYDLRVSAISRASQRIFEGLGAWRGMCARRVSPYREMHVWDAAGPGRIHFSAAELGEPDLGHIIENSVVQAALLERLAALDGARWYCPAGLRRLQVTEGGAQVELSDGRRLTAALVVGADGANSRVRELSGISRSTRAYDQRAVVATVRTERGHAHTAWQRFLPTGPLAFLPLADGRCSIVWSADTAEAGRLMAMEDTAFRQALGRALDYRLGQVIETGPRAAFTLRGSQAVPYVRPRIALVGDAAHTIHPLAGQGANLGFLDAATLAEVLLRQGGDPGAYPRLRRYERARRGDNLAMMRAMEGFKLLFGAQAAPLRRLRNLGLTLTDRAVPVKHALMRRAMGLSGELPALARSLPGD